MTKDKRRKMANAQAYVTYAVERMQLARTVVETVFSTMGNSEMEHEVMDILVQIGNAIELLNDTIHHMEKATGDA